MGQCEAATYLSADSFRLLISPRLNGKKRHILTVGWRNHWASLLRGNTNPPSPRLQTRYLKLILACRVKKHEPSLTLVGFHNIGVQCGSFRSAGECLSCRLQNTLRS